MPVKLKQYLGTKVLPGIVNFMGKIFQGMNNVHDCDAEFNQLYKDVKSRSLLDKKRAFVVYKFAKNCMELKGSFAEFGVYKGSTSRIMYEASNKKKDIYCFDTFEGLHDIDNTKDPFWRKGDMKEVDYNDVKSFLQEDNFKLIKGVFPESSINIPNDVKYSFVHIDVDVYQSAKDGCEYFYNRMIKGGVILFDDYGFLSCVGLKKAVDIFFQDKKESPIPLFTGQCFIYKN